MHTNGDGISLPLFGTYDVPGDIGRLRQLLYKHQDRQCVYDPGDYRASNKVYQRAKLRVGGKDL